MDDIRALLESYRTRSALAADLVLGLAPTSVTASKLAVIVIRDKVSGDSDMAFIKIRITPELEEIRRRALSPMTPHRRFQSTANPAGNAASDGGQAALDLCKPPVPEQAIRTRFN